MTLPITDDVAAEILTSLDANPPADPLTTYVIRSYDRAHRATTSPSLFGRVGAANRRFEELVTEEPQNDHYLMMRSSKTSTVLRHSVHEVPA